MRCPLPLLIAGSLLASVAAGQQLDERPLPPLGTPKVSSDQAIEVGRKFLAMIGQPSDRPVTNLRHMPSLRGQNLLGSTWEVTYGDAVVSVNAQTGRIYQYIRPGQIRDLFMFRSKAGQPFWREQMSIKPAMKAVPDPLLLTAGSKVHNFFYDKPGPQFHGVNDGFIERPNGYPVLNASMALIFDFDPRDRKLVAYRRAVDFEPAPAKVTLTKERAVKLANERFEKANLRLQRFTQPYREEEALLGYVIVTPRLTEITFVPEPPKGYLVWSVRTPAGEIWIDAATGETRGGWRGRIRQVPASGGRGRVVG